MSHKTLRAIMLACALAIAPSCASLPRLENPIAIAQSVDARAYALMGTYAALIEEAADLVRAADTPPALKRALGSAERAATPAVEALGIAVIAYARARRDLDAAPAGDSASLAASFAIAARHLSDAILAAEQPIQALAALVRTDRS